MQRCECRWARGHRPDGQNTTGQLRAVSIASLTTEIGLLGTWEGDGYCHGLWAAAGSHRQPAEQAQHQHIQLNTRCKHCTALSHCLASHRNPSREEALRQRQPPASSLLKDSLPGTSDHSRAQTPGPPSSSPSTQPWAPGEDFPRELLPGPEGPTAALQIRQRLFHYASFLFFFLFFYCLSRRQYPDTISLRTCPLFRGLEPAEQPQMPANLQLPPARPRETKRRSSEARSPASSPRQHRTAGHRHRKPGLTVTATPVCMQGASSRPAPGSATSWQTAEMPM